MIVKEKINRLVIFTLSTIEIPLKANEIYEIIKTNHSQELRNEQITSVKCFAQTLRTVKQIEKTENLPHRYYIQKQI